MEWETRKVSEPYRGENAERYPAKGGGEGVVCFAGGVGETYGSRFAYLSSQAAQMR